MITTKGRYALRMMIALAEQEREEYVSLKRLASSQSISEGYLARIMSELSSAGLVEAVQGKGGGYRLSRLPAEYSVEEILRASGEELAPAACVRKEAESCSRQTHCPAFPVWDRLDGLIREFLEGVSLQDLIPAEKSG